MIRYTITTWSSDTAMRATAYVERWQAPAARAALWTAVYEMIEAEAPRDRPIAYNLRDQVDACEVSPPPLGHYRVQRFRLRDGGAFVEFRAERINRPLGTVRPLPQSVRDLARNRRAA